MFYLNKQTELTTTLLKKMFERFNVEVAPKLNTYKNYYDGLHAILSKSYSDSTKPCNKIVTNYCKNIVDSYNGYIASPSFISYQSEEDIEEVMKVLRYNDYQTEDSNFLLNALIYGVSAELMFTDEEGKVRFRLINPRQCFAVCDDSLTGDLLYFVRWYEENTWDNNSNDFIVDVYDSSTVKKYKMKGIGGTLTFVEEDVHHFGQCPANIFSLPDEKSIFDCIMSLQDAVNTLVSAEVDDYEAFCDAYMTLEGLDADNDDIATMKENRVILLPEGAKAAWLTKNANDAQVENMLKRAHNSIYRTAQCPDFSSESFVGGVSSGIAIRYRLTGMENRAGTIEGAMKQALQRRVELIAGVASLRLGEEVFRDIQITFKRNIPTDNTDIINIVNALKGNVSDATLLSNIPFVTDVDAELEALKEQKAQNMALYNFGSHTTTEEDEEEEV